MNALEMKLIAMKFVLARREHIPNDKKFTSTSGAYDIGSIQQQLGQGITIDDRDLTITNTIIEDCDHDANVAVTTSTRSPSTDTPAVPEPEPEPEPEQQLPEPEVQLQEPVPPIPEEHVGPEIKVEPAAPAGFGGRIWQYFKDTTNVQPKS